MNPKAEQLISVGIMGNALPQETQGSAPPKKLRGMNIGNVPLGYVPLGYVPLENVKETMHDDSSITKSS